MRACSASGTSLPSWQASWTSAASRADGKYLLIRPGHVRYSRASSRTRREKRPNLPKALASRSCLGHSVAMQQGGTRLPGLYDPRHERDSCGMGFVAHVRGLRSNAIIAQGLRILANLDHRGGVGADPSLGDGAGCLIQIPDALFRAWAEQERLSLPPEGDYAVAMCFLPRDEASRAAAIERFERFIRIEGQVLVGWREVPVDTDGIGGAVLASMPVIRQAVVARGP